jgi:hypothetical protein
MKSALNAILLVCVAVAFQACARVGGSGTRWLRTGNLLQNATASSSTLANWTQNGTWTVNSGPVTLGSFTIDSCDGSPWFLASNGVGLASSCSACQATKTAGLEQTVTFPVRPGFFGTHVAYVEYGGDVFAAATATGSGVPGYQRHAGYDAEIAVAFLDSLGQVVATDTSGPIIQTVMQCVGFPVNTFQRCTFRRTVNNIPAATVAVRFTATATNRLDACNNTSTSSTYRNGFDNLYLDLGYLGFATSINSTSIRVTPGRHPDASAHPASPPSQP